MRDRWMRLRDNALGEASLPSRAEEVLRKFFNEMSTFMINQSESGISEREATRRGAPSKALALILAKTIEDPKGHILVPFWVSCVLALQRHPIQTVVTLRSLRTKTPATRRLPELHVWQA
jgi:hypothetical protein